MKYGLSSKEVNLLIKNKSKKVYHTNYFVLYSSFFEDKDYSRVSVIFVKKLRQINKPKKNRIKRIIRELFNQKKINPGYTCLVIIKKMPLANIEEKNICDKIINFLNIPI